MGQRHKHADVIIAWAEGKEVQVRSPIDGLWLDLTIPTPTFTDEEYRIKPPAKKCRVALFNNGRRSYTGTVDTPEDADLYEKEAPYFIRWLTDWIEYEEETMEMNIGGKLDDCM